MYIWRGRTVFGRQDPVLGTFLDFLAQAAHPDRLRALDAGLVERIEALVNDVGIDIDAPLSPDDE